jgi:hypothetical protein
MNTGNSGIGLYNAGTGQLRPGPYSSHASDHFWALNPQPFAPWEVALTVVAAVVMVATVVVFIRRLRAG